MTIIIFLLDGSALKIIRENGVLEQRVQWSRQTLGLKLSTPAVSLAPASDPHALARSGFSPWTPWHCVQGLLLVQHDVGPVQPIGKQPSTNDAQLLSRPHGGTTLRLPRGLPETPPCICLLPSPVSHPYSASCLSGITL